MPNVGFNRGREKSEGDELCEKDKGRRDEWKKTRS